MTDEPETTIILTEPGFGPARSLDAIHFERPVQPWRQRSGPPQLSAKRTAILKPRARRRVGVPFGPRDGVGDG